METACVIDATNGQELGGFLLITALVLLLVLFGIGYDRLTVYLEKRHLLHGWSSLLVVAGVGITLLAAVPLIGWRAVALVVVLFGASGGPMVVGQMYRRWRNERDFVQRLMMEQVRNADNEPGVADSWQG